MKRTFATAVLCCILASPAAPHAVAQEMLRGVVIDAAGEPVAGVPLGLHHIGDAGGALAGEATSDAAGRFEIEVAAPAAAETIYFVTARYRDELFIGPTFRPPFPEGADYVVQVGVDEASASAMLRGTGDVIVGPAPSPWRWALLGIFVLALLGVAAGLTYRAVGPPPRRRLLARIARLDEEFDGVGEGIEDDDYRARRERLFERLRTAD